MFSQKAFTLALAGIGSLLSSLSWAGPPTTSYEYAPVVDVQPIVRVVQVERPRRECWQEEVYEEHSTGHGHKGPLRTAGPTIAGGIVGGVIGHQFGSGSGNDAMTLLGTLMGAAIANQRAHRRAYAASQSAEHEVRPVTVERCQTTTERFAEERVEGYRVTYAYQGRSYTMRTREHPGEQVKLRVQVAPVQEY